MRGLSSIIVALFAIACGARQQGSGEYRGPNLLDFTVQSPIQRVLPQERHDGSVVVYDSGDYVTFDLRIFGGNETPCRVNAQRSPEQRGLYDILPGQQCASNFRYEGNPVTAIVQINEGGAQLDQRHILLSMQGPFIAQVQTADGRVVPTQGFAVWRFEGFQ